MTRSALVSLLAVLTLAGCTSGGSPASPGDSTAASQGGTSGGATAARAEQACRRDYTPRPLPSWARVGFRPPTLPMPYVVSDGGDIVAILWSEHDPLVVPPAADRNNKILWVARVGVGGSLQIRARLTSSGESVTRSVDGGPGPSVIDLPAPGCWSFDLAWGDQHDHLQLEYASS
jgi:hypothetical protein